MVKKSSRKKTLDHYLGVKPGKHLEESGFILAALILLMMISGLVLYFSNQNTQDFQPSQIKRKQIVGSVSLTIDFGRTRRAFSGSIYDDTTLYAALWQAAKVGKIQLHTDLEKNSGHISFMGLNSKLNSKKGHWVFYVNGKRIGGNIDEVLLKAGDKILARYE